MVRMFPIYVARSSLGGCGHQHSHRHVAENCGKSTLQRHPTLPYVEIVKVTRNTRKKHETDPETIETLVGRVNRD